MLPVNLGPTCNGGENIKYNIFYGPETPENMSCSQSVLSDQITVQTNPLIIKGSEFEVNQSPTPGEEYFYEVRLERSCDNGAFIFFSVTCWNALGMSNVIAMCTCL